MSTRPTEAASKTRGREGLPVIRRLYLLLIAVLLVLAGCSTRQDNPNPPPGSRVVALPGAAGSIDFDDIVYSPQLQRVLVPARDSGLYLVDPDSATATRVPTPGSAASADEGRGLLFLADRSARKINVLNPGDGHVRASVPTAAAPDYVRYVDTTGELWVTEPGASPPGIEIFAFSNGPAPNPQPVGSIPVPNGPEGFAFSAKRRTAYTHTGDDLVAIDVTTRTISAKWPTGCQGTHGFPRVDDNLGVVLASCAADGAVSLLDLNSGRQLGRYQVGGGAALPAWSDRTGHFYVRSDPGTAIAALQPAVNGLTQVGQVTVPKAGHCLTADDRGHYWTCDADHGRVLRFDDPNPG
jgi:hypothetical protein